MREFLINKIASCLEHLAISIVDELENKKFLMISPEKVHYFVHPELIFGKEVFDAFASANEDIAEAGTCLALERATASVMHLMRVVEAGLAVLAKALGVTKQNDWGRYLKEIDNALAARMKASGARSPDEQFYAEVAVTIDHMRRAWRNPTMHPEKTYSPKRAEEILQSVRSFMRQLVTKLHE